MSRERILTKKNIPVWCNIRKDKLTVTTREDAMFVLAHVGGARRLQTSGFGTYTLCGSNYNAYAIKCEDIWLYYIKVSTPAMLVPPHVRRTLSAMFSMVENYDFGDMDGTRYLRREFQVEKLKIAHAKVKNGPKEREFEREKISAEHHTHYRPEEIWKVLVKHKVSLRAASLVLDALRKIEGVTESVVSTFLLYILYVKPQVAYIIASSKRIWSSGTVAELASRLKEISTPLKSLHNREICDLTQLFELQTLVNRGIGRVNWDAERLNRQKPDTINVSPQDVYNEALRVFEMGLRHGYKYRKMTLDKYVDTRWEWVPTGSVHSQYDDDERFIKHHHLHRTKFVTLNMMTGNDIYKMFKREPEIQAWASVKYEWAKQRAIYGVDLTSSVITNFAMFRCEEVLRHKFPVGEEAEASRVHKRLKAMLDGYESYCYDFDDFNAQHSTESMYAVLKAYHDTFRDSMSSDQSKAMDWVCKSIYNVKINNNMENRNESYKPKGTLLSGWRLTTFINTVLNYIYFKISGCLESREVADSVHNGDDVLLSIGNLKAAVLVNARMAYINARAQATKCNVFSIGEFLRVEHKLDKNEGMGAQYLARSMATMAHSRIESKQPDRAVEAVKAEVTRCTEATMRAEGAAEKSYDLLRISLSNLAKVFKLTEKQLETITKSHVLVGGALEHKTALVDTKIEEFVYETELEVGESNTVEEIATVDELGPGIRAYARELSKMFGEYVSYDSVKKRVCNATRRQLSVTRKTWLIMTDVRCEQKYKYGREMFRMYRRLINAPHLDKARFVGISPIAMTDHNEAKLIKKLIGDVVDVEYALRVLL